MRQPRTIYFNDARHYYLFVFEPPMRLEDAQRPIDEVAGTAVDTFIYGVSRGATGLFYPSEVGMMFGADLKPFQHSYEWRSWENMQSLIAAGHDPLGVLIDRAHEKGMEFFASLRLGDYGGMNPEHSVEQAGGGFRHADVRDYYHALFGELVDNYAMEGLELDFAAPTGGSTLCFNREEAPDQADVLTDFVRQVAAMVRQHPDHPGQVGTRVYPTEELNRRAGVDVQTWLEDGLVDYVVPMAYSCFVLDANMPFEWIVEPAHRNEISVYGMLQPYYGTGRRYNTTVEFATPAMMRAAAANFWQAGVDGLYTWFMPWPLGEPERRTLTEIGDPDLVVEGDKHYFLRWNEDDPERFDYPTPLPLEIASADADRRYPIEFTIADDGTGDQVQQVHLKLNVTNLVTPDQFVVWLNGSELSSVTCRRSIRPYDTYTGQWLDYDLAAAPPRRGRNLLELALLSRPEGFAGGVTVEDVEITVEYDVFPTVK